jgi:hypothetical protein
MSARIKTHCDELGVWYWGTREQLIGAGLATWEMFPEASESWRGNGLSRTTDEPLWSVERAGPGVYKVLWGMLDIID